MPYSQSLFRAQEAREMHRRDEEMRIGEISQYWDKNKVLEDQFNLAQKSEIKRKEREMRERAHEADRLESLYRVSAVCWLAVLPG
mmetsp:Transcript_43909/g.139920  ORF Transcript_43909/g.139920 Transcript_43909/m.139920 type:complete len:85 (-) Transcript_43909:50-304(-)